MTAFYGEILILLLIIVICSRVFFIKHTRIDSIVLFAPLVLVLAILQIFAWGLNISELIIFYFSFFIFFINWRGFLRFCNRLYVDTYSSLFIVFSAISLISAIGLIVFFCIFSPLHLNAEKYQVNVGKKFFTKNPYAEYVEAPETAAKKDLKLTVYSPDIKQEREEQNEIILFVPDKRAARLSYEPYLILLAKYGYTVYKADFGFADVQPEQKINLHFLKQHKMTKTYFKNPEKFYDEYSSYEDIYAREYEILSAIADKTEPHTKQFVIVADGLAEKSLYKIKNPARQIELCFLMSSIPEYKTSGFGFIEQADPVTAKLKFNLKKDRTFFVPSYMAMKTKTAIEAKNDIN
ncbi:MAG: hypothetical protein ACI4LX_06655 [Treponema sp.]